MLELLAFDPPAAVNLRGNGSAAFADAVRAATGLSLPLQPNTYTGAGDRSLLWLGPDEWGLLDTGRDGSKLETELAQALGENAAAVCDVSGNRVAIGIRGERAAELLSRGCALDLAAMEPGRACAQTLVARAQVILLYRGADHFEVMPRRSFGHYLTSWLAAAAANL